MNLICIKQGPNGQKYEIDQSHLAWCPFYKKPSQILVKCQYISFQNTISYYERSNTTLYIYNSSIVDKNIITL